MGKQGGARDGEAVNGKRGVRVVWIREVKRGVRRPSMQISAGRGNGGEIGVVLGDGAGR